ncbi:hypothetical protein ACFVIM_01860 [Streptomyces sp. NPDC057638]|uniref:hypothetical protein n=1 Tax=Streptomyces sp. NPDC057638 TaxID=3346190 RepID=UPI00367BBDCC
MTGSAHLLLSALTTPVPGDTPDGTQPPGPGRKPGGEGPPGAPAQRTRPLSVTAPRAPGDGAARAPLPPAWHTGPATTAPLTCEPALVGCAPLTSEPPLTGGIALTSEPSLCGAAPLTSE